MKIEQIVYFLDIAQTQSISRTAERYFISQQAVSDAMKRLEQEFSCQLLRRKKNGVALTEEGEMFWVEAKKMMEVYTALQLKINPKYKIKAGVRGRLNLVVHPRMYHLGLKDFLNHWQAKYPEIRISFFEGDTRQMMDSLEQQQADLGVLFTDEGWTQFAAEIREKMRMQTLYRDRVYVCYTAEHPLASVEKIELKMLGGFDMTCFAAQHNIHTYLKEAAKQQSANVYFCNDVATQCDLIKAGTAAGVLTGYEYRTLFKKEDQVLGRLLADELADIVMIFWPKTDDQPLLNLLMRELTAFYTLWGERLP